jgi:NAD-dependent deacetylase
VTQNIDGLHQKAGTDSERVIEVHGSMHEVVCVECGGQIPARAALARVEAGEDDPPCQECGGIQKTGTVYFGQALDPVTLERARDAARACDVFLAAGTSLQVYPVAWLPTVARGAGGRVVIVNAEPTPYDDEADVVIHGGVGEVLPAIVDRI